MKQLIQISAKLYECHETARRFYRDEFHSKIKWYVDAINGWSEKHKTDTLKSVLSICQLDSVKDNGLATMLFLAAAVEIIEPSQPIEA